MQEGEIFLDAHFGLLLVLWCVSFVHTIQMLGQLADKEHRRHLVVTAELATPDEQVAALGSVFQKVLLRVILVVVFRLFKYRVVVVLAAKVAFTPFGELTKTFGDIIQLL